MPGVTQRASLSSKVEDERYRVPAKETYDRGRSAREPVDPTTPRHEKLTTGRFRADGQAWR